MIHTQLKSAFLWTLMVGAPFVFSGEAMAQRESDSPRGSALRREAQRRFLERFDKDGDGRLSTEERRAAFMSRPAGNPNATDNRPSMSGQPPQMLVQVIERFDTNKNGVLDPAEIQRARQQFQQLERVIQTPQAASRPALTQLIRRFDKNNDKRLTGAELAAMKQSLQQALAFASSLNDPKAMTDRKRPGTTPTTRQVPQAILDRFDENKNGRLDPAELAKVREAFGRSRGGTGGIVGILDESGEGVPATLDVSSAIADFDADGDGKLSPSERRKALAAAKKR